MFLIDFVRYKQRINFLNVPVGKNKLYHRTIYSEADNVDVVLFDIIYFNLHS